jgi:beta-N-acetylglucosaminidase
METVTEYADQKTELEGKIRSLETERATLLSDITSLKEKMAAFELQRTAETLTEEVESLRTEKAVLEEKVSAFTTPEEQKPQPTEGFQA